MSTVSGRKFLSLKYYSRLSTIIFILIICFYPGIFLYSSLISSSDIFVSVLVFIGVSILSLWSFLRRPYILIRSKKMEYLSTSYPHLAEYIQSKKEFSQLKYPPTLLRIPSNTVYARAFGTWRTQYIAISDGAIKLWPASEDKLSPVMKHELAHVMSGDVWKTDLSYNFVIWYSFWLVFSIINTYSYSQINTEIQGHWIFISTSLYVVFFLVIATRFLLRIREFAADHYVAIELNESKDMLEAFAAIEASKLAFGKSSIAFVDNKIGNNLLALFGFHPSMNRRLRAIQDPKTLMEEMPGLMLVAGLAVGTFFTFFGTLDTVPVLILGILVIAPPLVLHALKQYFLYDLSKIMYLIIVDIFTFLSGVVVPLVLHVGINILFITNPIDGSLQMRTASSLRYTLSLLIDAVMIVIFILPLIILIIIAMSYFLAKYMASNRSEYPLFIAWTAQFPAISLFSWFLFQWWSGNSIFSLESILTSVFSVLVWPIVVLLVVWLKSRLFSGYFR